MALLLPGPGSPRSPAQDLCQREFGDLYTVAESLLFFFPSEVSIVSERLMKEMILTFTSPFY